MSVSKRIGWTLCVLLLGLLLTAPVWSQEAEEPTAPFVGELVELAWRYAQQELEIGPQQQAEARHQLAVGIATQAGEMKRLGYGEQQIAQAVMAAVRSAVQQHKRLAAGSGTGMGTGEQLGTQIREQLRQRLEAGDLDRDRDQDRTGWADEDVPPGGGPGSPGGGGKPE